MGKLEGVNEPQGEGRQRETKREGGRFENFAVGGDAGRERRNRVECSHLTFQGPEPYPTQDTFGVGGILTSGVSLWHFDCGILCMGLPHHVAIRFSRTGKGIQFLSFLGEKRCSNHAVVL